MQDKKLFSMENTDHQTRITTLALFIDFASKYPTSFWQHAYRPILVDCNAIIRMMSSENQSWSICRTRQSYTRGKETLVMSCGVLQYSCL